MENINKKVLIVAYYWPPSGGSGVQRWLKFVKYLPVWGVKPYVFTPANPSFDVRDESLVKDVPTEAEVIRFPIWEPYAAFFKLSGFFGSKKTAKPTDLVATGRKSIFQKASTWVRGNFFIPDPRVFWVRPSVRYLAAYLREHNINTIITTGPPHSIHLIGLRLKKKNPALRWLADFRDPWSTWGLLDSLNTGTLARRRHRALESAVLRTADTVITITPFFVRLLEKLSGRTVTLLTNGFDEDDFRHLAIQQTPAFVLRHVGIVNEKCDPRPFMLAMKELLAENEAMRSLLRIDFTGEVHAQFRAFVASVPEIAAVTTFSPPVPHKQVIPLYGASSVLLLVLTGYKDAEGYMPGKLFEYIATGLPVLGVGPEQGDAAQLLSASGCGKMIDGGHTAAIRKFVLEQFEHWRNSIDANRTRAVGSHAYSRREITRQLADLL